MDDAHLIAAEQATAPETPEDVAILYSWANLPGAKYRDFSASRREYRAQQRARAAETQRQAELAAARELEEAAQREVDEAQRQLEETQRAEAQAAADADAKHRAEEALRLAEERAEQERSEAQRREQQAEELRQRADRAREEMVEARKRAEEQAARYAEVDAQYHEQMSRGRKDAVPGATSDPYYYAGHADPAYFAATPGVRTAQAARTSTERKAYGHTPQTEHRAFEAEPLPSYKRSSNNFAPSPAQPRRTPSSPLREAAVERLTTADDHEGKAHPRSGGGDDSGYYLDDYYFHREPSFEPYGSSGRDEQGRRTSAAADLHIRPSTRSSSDDVEAYLPVSRRAPLPNVSVPVPRQLGPDRNLSRDKSPLREVSAGDAAAESISLPRHEKRETLEGAARTERYEFPEGSGNEGSPSRMFIPSPRGRVIPAGEPSNSGQNGTGSATQLRGRTSHENEDRPVSPVRRLADDYLPEDAHPAITRRRAEAGPSPEVVSERGTNLPGRTDAIGDAGHWRALNRPYGGSARRRRELGPSPIARTVRQPRTEEAIPDLGSPAAGAEASSAPPAWLSAERPAATEPVLNTYMDLAPARFLPETEDSTPPVPRSLPNPVPAQTVRPRTTPVGSELTPYLAQSGLDERWRPAAARDGSPETNAVDTLQQSRERVASRWFALSGLMGSEHHESRDTAELRPSPSVAPNLCVLSISGGVGKTSIVATLGRALSSVGEKVLLVDTNVHGILPYYFGAREQRPGLVRTFAPPSGSVDAPVVLVSYDADSRGYDESAQARVMEDLARRSQSTQRVLLDVGVNSVWLARKLARDNPWILVPVAPDMNSVLGTQAVERLFQDVIDREGRPVKPYYVLNQYDPSLPLHLDVREVLRQFLGDRLLPIMLHRTPAVSEALAEGMTVIDYASGTPIAEDYRNLAAWLREMADPGSSYPRGARWSER